MTEEKVIEILISEVSKRPLLWNHKLKNYKSTTATNPLWEQVAEILKCSVEVAKKKFKTVKDRYRKERQVRPACSGAAAGDYQSQWPYFSLCGFLDDLLPASNTEDNFANDGDETIVTVDQDVCTDQLQPTSSDTESTTSEDIAFLRPYKRARKSDEDHLQLERQKVQLLEKHITQKSIAPPKQDEDAAFLLSLLPYIKELSTLERLCVRQEIQNVVLEAQKRKLLVEFSIDN